MPFSCASQLERSTKQSVEFRTGFSENARQAGPKEGSALRGAARPRGLICAAQRSKVRLAFAFLSPEGDPDPVLEQLPSRRCAVLPMLP